jgi:hypothetical protein
MSAFAEPGRPAARHALADAFTHRRLKRVIAIARPDQCDAAPPNASCGAGEKHARA